MDYGAMLTDSAMASSLLKVAEIYPDSIGGSDQITFAYNRQQQTTQTTDQGGTAHAYDYDKLGRRTQDRVIAFGTDVDTTVKRIETEFDERGLVSRITSWDNATVGSGSVLNEVATMYNDFGQALQTFQAHDGEVDPLSTPSVQMAYADGSDNTTRQVSLTYPNGRVLTYAYGTTDGIDDAASRIVSIIDDDSTHLVDYEYLGQSTFVTSTSPEPGIQWTLVGSSDDPDTGDIYTGLDRFGRVKDNRWHKSGTDLDRIKYGYDRASNRIWRENPVATANNAAFDEIYGYDAIQRLKTMARGTLNVGHTALTSETFGQCWQLDATGNWQGFKETDNGSTWTLEQTRDANTVNEITGITNSVGSSWAKPSYSAAGNMTTIPQGDDPTKSYTATYDAWNRLVKLEEDVSSTLETVAEYRYDGRNFQITQREYTSGVLDVTKHQYYTDGWQNIEQRDEANTTPDQHYIWGRRYIDDCLLRDRTTTTTLDERLYVLQDANWNVDAIANKDGVIAIRFSYEAFGNPTVMDSSFTPLGGFLEWIILACGYPQSLATGLYSVRLRFLASHLGTWISRDPLGYVNVSLYTAHPVIFHTDPTGAAPQKTVMATSTLSCTIDKIACPCKDDKSDCEFTINLLSHPIPDGSYNSVEVSLEYTQGPTRPRAGSPVNPMPCMADYGRTDTGTIEVTTASGTTCKYDSKSFNDPGGTPSEEIIRKECLDIIDFKPKTSFPEGNKGPLNTPIQMNGVSYIFKNVKSIAIDFEIETFCGCGGTDALGRPQKRNTGKMNVKGKLP